MFGFNSPMFASSGHGRYLKKVSTVCRNHIHHPNHHSLVYMLHILVSIASFWKTGSKKQPVTIPLNPFQFLPVVAKKVPWCLTNLPTIELDWWKSRKESSYNYLGANSKATVIGKMWVPLGGYLIAVVPKILPYIALCNHYITHLLVVYVGIYLGYSPKGIQLFPLILGVLNWVKFHMYVILLHSTTYTHSANGPWKKKFELYFPY